MRVVLPTDLCYDEVMNGHQHKFQIEGDTWTCFGWDGACGLRAPACFVPDPDKNCLTNKGLIDLIIGDTVSHKDVFTAEHLVIVTVP